MLVAIRLYCDVQLDVHVEVAVVIFEIQTFFLIVEARGLAAVASELFKSESWSCEEDL